MATSFSGLSKIVIYILCMISCAQPSGVWSEIKADTVLVFQ